jgi:hypothetical protein
MKKISIIFVLFMTLFTFLGCVSQNNVISMMDYEINGYEVNNYANASMEVVDSSISNQGLTVLFNYSGDNNGSTGSWFSLFYYEDNVWKDPQYIVDEDVMWTSEAYIVEKNKTSEMQVNWDWLYGELSTGRYLIVKQFINHREPGDYDIYYLASEFTI